ncbi:MAG: ATP-dependent 6-phosphofructokinase [Terrimicrobiaceae bacterium]|nr:ATP-dependent 6-phosphofructokinase [Terrimicrobiaceae bacterium]
MATKRIGVLTSGGDCPGLNAVLRAVVRAAENLGWEVLGFHDGYEGLLPEGGDYVILDRATTAGIMHLGGTMIGTTNRGHFAAKVRAGERAAIPDEIIQQARRTFDHLRLDALVAIGGDGSLTTALQMSEAGFPMIGVPKTIDNDLEATAMTFGFDSAVNCVADALDRLHTTATSHKRVMVLEVMGRHAGWIALYGGLAGGADIILIPEIPFDMEKVAEHVRERERQGAKSTMIVVAEGASQKNGKQSRHQTAVGEYRLGGIGEQVGHEVIERTGKDTRVCVLGHLQRGGAPTALDRILGTRFGVQAVQLIKEGRFGTMVSYQNYETRAVPIAHAVHRLRRVDANGQMMQTARAVGSVFGD